MHAKNIVLALGCSVLGIGCAQMPAVPPDTQEIVANLVRAGFPASDIMIVDGTVFVGRDAEVTLAASRELVRTDRSGKEQYRTTNLISLKLPKICIDGSTFSGAFSTALDLAIQNYNEQPLTFAMVRAPSFGCSFTITAVIQPGLVGGSSGFPSGGVPFSTINIGDGLSTFSVDVIEHVITHEIGHTIGFRHSDFFNRTISCGTGGSEGDAGVGAILIPGTPSDAVVGGSIMNSCFRSTETGEFTATDLVALKALYSANLNNRYKVGDWNGDGRDNLAVLRGGQLFMDFNFDGGSDLVQAYGNGSSAEDQYLVGDWDGDGRDNLAVRRGNQIFMDFNFDGGSDLVQSFGNGNSEDQYLVGDWDGDGRDNIAVRRGGQIFMDFNFDGVADFVQSFGNGDAEDQYLVGDWDGDGRDNIAVRRGGQIFMDTNFDGAPDIVQSFGNGNAEDQYLVGDWDGDGRDNIAVRRGGQIFMDFNFDGASDLVQGYGNGNAEDP